MIKILLRIRYRNKIINFFKNNKSYNEIINLKINDNSVIKSINFSTTTIIVGKKVIIYNYYNCPYNILKKIAKYLEKL